MLNICQIGAGRIGKIHAANVAQHPGARLKYIIDAHAPSAESLAQQYGANVTDIDSALADAGIDAVIIASSTDTHADYMEVAARAGKAIFCEKPIDLDLARVERCLKVVEKAGVPCALGFNRRFDPMFSALQKRLAAGQIGKLELLSITSRDPAPPPANYVKSSGGLFRDMMIHDFDMARWLLGEEPVEVYATASCLVDPAIGAMGDVDTALVTLKTAGGRLCQISNSRRAVYGYDQRIEAHGEFGMLRAENRTETQLEQFGEQGVVRDKPLYFFLERYAEAYRAELADFIDAVTQNRAPLVGASDGRQALVLAEAAQQSIATGQPIRL